jgi:hypothetical protein
MKNMIIFHGINLSAGLSLALAVKNAINSEGLPYEYHAPDTGFKREFLSDITFYTHDKLGRSKFVFDHEIMHYPLIADHAKLITVLRDPVSRIVSVFYYLKDNHPYCIEELELVKWIERHGLNYSQFIQFSCLDKKEKPQKHFTEAIDFLDKRVDYFGFSDNLQSFSNTISDLMHSKNGIVPLSIDSGSANPYREGLPDSIRDDIEDLIPYDIAFYTYAKHLKLCRWSLEC